MDKPLISLVMIVKDEAAILRETLERCRPVVDEWVIVDTGSTDGTQAIISEYGPLHELPFEDFVTTKNKALALAMGKYILFMDADERLLTGAEKLRAVAEAGEVDGFSCRIIDGPSPDQVVTQYDRYRLWYNNRLWRFEGPGVHEVVAAPAGARVLRDPSVVVWHDHRHRDGDSFIKRSEWYIELLQAALQREPSDTRAMFYLARTFKDLGRWFEAIEAYERYLAAGGWHDEQWQACYDLALCWRELGEWDHAREACQRALAIDPRRAEVAGLIGRLHYEAREWREAVAYLRQAAGAEIPEDVTLFLDPREYREIPADFLALSLHHLGEHEEAVRWGERAVAWAGRSGTDRLRDNAWWYRRRARRLWFFALGHTPEPVHGAMLDHVGAGGVETTYIELPKALQTLGQECFVFCRCEAEHVVDGVRFVPWERMGEYCDLNPDVLVTSRWLEPLTWPALAGAKHPGDLTSPGCKKILWLQDAYFADPGRAFEVVDRVVVSSLWHRNYTLQRYGHGIGAGKLRVINLGIRRELFGGAVARRGMQAVYSSNPDRGLQELAAMWPEIVAQVPDLRLVVTYGWEGLRTWDASPSWQARCDQVEAEIRGRFDGQNVIFTGRLSKPDLARVLMQSDVCLYPCNFFETFCLTALECQAAGLPVVTSEFGALATTLAAGAGVKIPGHPNSPAYRRQFVRAAVDVLQDAGRRRAMGAAGVLHVAGGLFGWADVAEQWRRLEWGF